MAELPSARKEELHEEFARAQQSRTASSGPDGDEAGPRLSGLQLFYGPMYAGKTSALAKEITKLKVQGCDAQDRAAGSTKVQLNRPLCVAWQASGQQGMQVVKSLVDWRYDSLDKDGKGQIRDGQIVTHSGERHVCPCTCTACLVACSCSRRSVGDCAWFDARHKVSLGLMLAALRMNMHTMRRSAKLCNAWSTCGSCQNSMISRCALADAALY